MPQSPCRQKGKSIRLPQRLPTDLQSFRIRVLLTTMSQIDKVRTVFNEWAENGRADGMELGHGPTAIQAFDSLDLAPGQRYLDIDCGNGYTLRWAAERCRDAEIWGVDVSPNMISLAKDMDSSDAEIRYLCGQFPHPEIPENYFDAIFSMEVFYYMPAIQSGLVATAQALKDGGKFVCIVDYYQENSASHSWPEDTGVAMTLWSAQEWREGFEAAGLSQIEQKRLRPDTDTEAPDWKHNEGSLMTIGTLLRA